MIRWRVTAYNSIVARKNSYMQNENKKNKTQKEKAAKEGFYYVKRF